jgi:hypothetical protein
MAKLKKAPGRIIGRWKEEAIRANPGASDEDLAKIVNEMASKQGYGYKIAPEKVRTKTKKAGPKPAPTRAHTPTPAPKPTPVTSRAEGALMADLRAFVGLVGKEGARVLLNDIINRL